MNLQLEDKLALVTGSTAGIGLAIARSLAAERARVIVNGRSEARVAQAIGSIRAETPSARVEGLVLDLSKADAAIGVFPHSQAGFAIATLCHHGGNRSLGYVR